MYIDLDGHSPISQSGNGDNGPDKNYAEKMKNKVIVASRVLKVGLKGYDVKVLQAELIKNGYKIQADGIYGSMTADAVRDYQKKHGLAVDGIAGDKTRTSLYCSSALAAAEANKVKKAKDTNEVEHSEGDSKTVQSYLGQAASVSVTTNIAAHAKFRYMLRDGKSALSTGKSVGAILDDGFLYGSNLGEP